MCPVRQTGVSEECQLQWQTCTRSQNRSSLDQGRPLNFLPQSSTVMSSKMENKWFYMGLKSLKKCNPEGSRAGKIPMIIFGNPGSVSSLSRFTAVGQSSRVALQCAWGEQSTARWSQSPLHPFTGSMDLTQVTRRTLFLAEQSHWRSFRF